MIAPWGEILFRVEITGEDEREVTAVVPGAKIPAFALTNPVCDFGGRPAIAQEEVGPLKGIFETEEALVFWFPVKRLGTCESGRKRVGYFHGRPKLS